MIFLYRIAFLPLFLLALPYYGWRMIRRGGYSKDFSHRFGLLKDLPKSKKTRVWIQAVSVGEVEALANLLKIMRDSGLFEVVLTTTTSTGYAILKKKYSEFCFYTGIFPFDFCLTNYLAYNRIKPDVCVLMEGELWPEHLHRAKARKIPLLLLNARLSDKSFSRYKKIPAFFKRLISKFDFIACGSDFDAERFLKLGADPEKLSVTGNIKFDSSSPEAMPAERKAELKRELGFKEDSLVLLGSSTWEGEEEMLFDIAQNIRQKHGLDLRLLLVPRHAERRASVRQMLEKKGADFHFRSESKQAPDGTLVYVADTTGELKMFTQLADFAFVGKSMPPHRGGQTPLDCAASAVACVYGPEMSNFRKLCKSLEEAKASVKVESKAEAAEALERLATDSDYRFELGRRAKAWHDSNTGASERSFEILKRFAK